MRGGSGGNEAYPGSARYCLSCPQGWGMVAA